MAKSKSTKKPVTRPTNSAAKYGRSTLVRVTPVAEAKEDAAEHDEQANETAVAVAAPKQTIVAPTATPKRTAPAVNLPAKTAAKNAVATQAAQAAQGVRKGKAAVRTANPGVPRTFIRAENYGYVVRDLRFIAVLAILVVITMIVLRIVIKG